MSTNREWISNLPINRLAELLVYCIQEPDWDYDYDENLYQSGFTDVFITSDGEKFQCYDEAIDHEIWWLKQEHKEEPKWIENTIM